MNVQRGLERAYGILEKRGWCQGHHTNPGGQVCLEGALVMGAGMWSQPNATDLHPFTPEVGRLRDQMLTVVKTVLVREGQIDPGYPAVFDWNDADERTVEDVKLILKKSIEYAEEQGL